MPETPNEFPFDAVVVDPADYFETPKSIVDDATLSRDEKLRLLDEWALDISERSTAADEGMVPDDSAQLDHDARTIVAIKSARATVNDSPDVETGSLPVRLWKRLSKLV